ncbi:MAG TPA: SAM-dependent methyltransferase [Mycobacterium sp.]|uniref:SAM-dependent methyltransferase n=1 Tax=Mycobacterium sp. TaxID=1785 RepID=UPI002D5285A9|nr:SAM-dependent methyltransferase [Mycobacterium sp.]HZU47199.1 SAM-dependent methyltransferase [Mycobacterium sp.]
MARTESDSWDITESVGATALGVAMARAAESDCKCPLFTDPYAQSFIDAAVERGWQAPSSGPMAERLRAIGGYAAARTKWFDEYFIAAGANGIQQVVILGAGLDTRAWRLPWVDGTVVYEIDQPKVLQFKSDTLARRSAHPAVGYVAVPVDLRQDWPKALREAGFDPSAATAWCAEGLIPYLSAADQDLMFERIAGLTSRGSRVAADTFSAGFFDPDYLERRSEKMRRLREASDMPPAQDLWFIEERTDLTEWLTQRGWQVTAIEALDLMERYGRSPDGDPEDAAPRSVFIEGRLTASVPSAT